MSSTESPQQDLNIFRLPSTGFFRNAPFTKFWFITLVLCSGARIALDVYRTRPLPVDSLADVGISSIFSAVFLSFVAKSVPELTICGMVIYLLRNIERRLGTRKYMNVLFVTLVISHGVHIGFLKLLTRTTDPNAVYFPYSPLVLVYISYINYLLEIPVFVTTMLLEMLPACDHHFILILLLQTLSQPTIYHFLIPAAVATVIYRLNLFYIQKFVLIPEWVGNLCKNKDSFIGCCARYFESLAEAKKCRDLPIGATLERQKIEEEDEIHRMMYQRQTRAAQSRVGPPPEALVRGLMEMGFPNRNEVVQALQQTGHNVEMAANLLLQTR